MRNHCKLSKKHGLKTICRSIILSTLIISTQSFAAGDPGPAEMANKAGFTKCNSLIRKTFQYHNENQAYRINTRYNKETAAHSIDIDMAYGEIGDTIVQSAHFERKDGVCYSYSSASFNQTGSCVELMHKDGAKYIASTAGAIWAENKLGATRIMTQTGNICTSHYFSGESMKQDRN